MGRLNLIFNGMMIFDDFDATTVKIIVPAIDGHVRRYCIVTQPNQTDSKPLDIGNYQLTGLPANNASLIGMIPPSYYLCVKKSETVLDYTAAGKISAIFTVPKPRIIRLFRGSEPTGNVFGNTPVGVAHAVPIVHHDVVVFSYFDLSSGTSIKLQKDDGTLLAAVDAIAGQTVNWEVRSDEAQPMTLGMPAHETTLNSLLSYGGVATDFSLSAIGLKDGNQATGIGLTPLHMAAYQELPKAMPGTVTEMDCGIMGCSGLARGDSGI